MINRLSVGPSIAIAMGLAKISKHVISIILTAVHKVLLSSYIVKHNGIDCGF